MASTPGPSELFTTDDFYAVWPTGAERVELVRGHPYFEGEFVQADVEAAERAFPQRRATLDPPVKGSLILHSSQCGPNTCEFWPEPGAPQQ